ncbi:MAG: hypothetical protein V7K26_09925 [Nostoc sp.]
MPRTVLYHPLALNPSALDIRHQLIKILVEWQIKSKNTHSICCQGVKGIGHLYFSVKAFQPTEAGFVCVAATSSRLVQDIRMGKGERKNL